MLLNIITAKFAKVMFSQVFLSRVGLCPGGRFLSSGSLSGEGGLCPGGGGLCPWISVREPPVRLGADGTHPTGMHSCFDNEFRNLSTRMTINTYFCLDNKAYLQ